MYRDQWREAIEVLHSTNNFPEFTGRICPAPCEEACTLNIDDAPVTIKSIESAIADRAWQEGWVAPDIPAARTGKRVAIVGSGPAGWPVHNSWRAPGMTSRCSRRTQARRVAPLRHSGLQDVKGLCRPAGQPDGGGRRVLPHRHACRGRLATEDLVRDYDAVVLAGGSEKARDLPVEGRDLRGVEFAMDFLPQQNRRISGEPLGEVWRRFPLAESMSS